MLSPSKMLSLGMPLLVAYLTYSTVGEGMRTVSQFAQPPAATLYKSRDVAAPEDVTTRDPFSQDVSDKLTQILGGPAAAVLGEGVVGEDPTDEKEQMKLLGTAIMGKFKIAIIDGKRLREGDKYQGMTLSVITVDRVIMTDAIGRNVMVPLHVATSDEIVLPEEQAKADAQRANLTEQAPLQRGLSALTGGNQGDIMKMLGIPES